MTLFTTPRRHKPSHYRSQHRYITDTYTHTCILRTVARSAISVYEIKSRRKGPRTSKIFFALLLRSPPPRTHVRFRFHSLFSAPNPPPPFSAFFRADDRRIERMQNGLRYIEQIQDMGGGGRWCHLAHLLFLSAFSDRSGLKSRHDTDSRTICSPRVSTIPVPTPSRYTYLERYVFGKISNSPLFYFNARVFLRFPSVLAK